MPSALEEIRATFRLRLPVFLSNLIGMKRDHEQVCDPARLAAFSVLSSFDRSPVALPGLLDARFEHTQLSPLDRSFVSHLVYGVTRFREQIDFVVGRHVSGGSFGKNRLKAALLRVGAFQMMPGTKVPVSAAINETVKLTRAVAGGGLTGFVNAVLRRVAAESGMWIELIPQGDSNRDLSIRYSQPKWLVRLLVQDHGIDTAQRFRHGFLNRLDTTVRHNPLRISRSDFEDSVRRSGVPVMPSPLQRDYYVLSAGVDLSRFEPLAQGECFVQNVASGIVAEYLSPGSGDRILDMCAAPGGKSAAIAILTGRPENIVAVDVDCRRMQAAEDGFAGLGLGGIKTRVADGRTLEAGIFDKILIDAPCSGLGTLAKHPEIKYTQSIANIGKLAAIQLGLLNNAARLLGTGGVLVYSVCTLASLETTGVMNEFLHSNENFALDVGEDFRYHQFVRSDGALLIPPGSSGLEGMFAFRARKVR